MHEDAGFEADARNATREEWRFGILHWSLASQNMWTMAVSTVPTAGFSAGSP
jgi:hypothetical protein